MAVAPARACQAVPVQDQGLPLAAAAGSAGEAPPGSQGSGLDAGTWRSAVQSSWPERRGSAGVLAFADLGDEVPDGGEGEVWAVSEDGVTRSGKAHQAGGVGRQLAG